MRTRRKILLGLLGTLLLFNLCLFLFDKTYFYTAIAKTYLSGQSGPGIYDLEKFDARKIDNNKPIEWLKHAHYNQNKLTAEDLSYFDKLGTVAFLAIKDGKILHQEYFEKHTDTSKSNSFSMAKSFVALLGNIAQRQGYITSFEEKVNTFLPQFNADGYNKLTLGHLSSMSSGLRWSESGGNPFSNNAEAYYGVDLKKLVNAMQAEEPAGEHFVYKSGNTAMLAMAIEKAVGMPLSNFASKNFWQELGAEHPAYWSLDHANGQEKAYCCWYATAKDFAKVGQLMLQQGNWNGKQLLDSNFIADCRTPSNTSLPDGSPNKRYSKRSWWLMQYNGAHYYYARGILGQYIIVLPEQQMVIVRLGHKRDETNEEGHPKDVYRYIDAALKMN